MKDPVVDVAPSSFNLAAEAKAVHKLHIAVRDAEGREKRTAVQADEAKQEAALARLALGRRLVEVRKQWPAKGPGRVDGKTWAMFLDEQGIEASTAWRYMELAGHVERPEVSCTPAAVQDTPPRIPTYRDAGIDNRPRVSDKAPSPVPSLAEFAPPPSASPSPWTDEARDRLKLADIASRQPPKMADREAKVRRLGFHLTAAMTAVGAITAEGLHLTDATTSDSDFESFKRQFLTLARVALDELEGAGALDAPEPRKRQLLILDGGTK